MAGRSGEECRDCDMTGACWRSGVLQCPSPKGMCGGTADTSVGLICECDVLGGGLPAKAVDCETSGLLVISSRSRLMSNCDRCSVITSKHFFHMLNSRSVTCMRISSPLQNSISILVMSLSLMFEISDQVLLAGKRGTFQS